MTEISHPKKNKRYKIIERIGKGSYGIVYRMLEYQNKHLIACSPDLKTYQMNRFSGNVSTSPEPNSNIREYSCREVAVKQIPDDEEIEAIRAEVNNMSRFPSPYIVEFYDSFLLESNYWIVMEYCEFGSIVDIMEILQVPLNEQQIAVVCKDMLCALAFLHSNKMLHRDVKPNNFLVTKEGKVKLADFGIAVTLENDTKRRNTVIGTPYYLAPEVIEESGYDDKADVWGFGISSYEMAVGSPPHFSVHPMRVLYLIMTNPPPKLPNTKNPSKLFEDFLEKCLTKDPHERYSAEKLKSHPFLKKVERSQFMPLLDHTKAKVLYYGGLEKTLKTMKHESRNKPHWSEVSFPQCYEQKTRTDEYLQEAPINLQAIEAEEITMTPAIESGEKLMNPTTATATPIERRGRSNSTGQIVSKTGTNHPNTSFFKLVHEWKGDNAGGCNKEVTWRNNNQFQLILKRDSKVKIELILKDNRHHVGVYLVKLLENIGNRRVLGMNVESIVDGLPKFTRIKCVRNFERITKGEYRVIPTTYQAKKEGSYELNIIVYHDPRATFTQINQTTDWIENFHESDWIPNINAGGCYSVKNLNFYSNPRYLLNVTTPGLFVFLLSRKETNINEKGAYIGFYVIDSENGFSIESIISKEKARMSAFTDSKEVSSSFTLQAGKYICIPCTYEENVASGYTFTAFSCSEFEFENSETFKIHKIEEAWTNSTSGGSIQYPTWRTNPQYSVYVEKECDVDIILRQIKNTELFQISFILIKTSKEKVVLPQILLPKKSDVVVTVPYAAVHEKIRSIRLSEGYYILIPSTLHQRCNAEYCLSIVEKTFENKEPKITINSLTRPYFICIEGRWNLLSEEQKRVPNIGGIKTVFSPRFLLSCTKSCTISVILVQNKQPWINASLHVFSVIGDNEYGPYIKNASTFCTGREVSLIIKYLGTPLIVSVYGENSEVEIEFSLCALSFGGIPSLTQLPEK